MRAGRLLALLLGILLFFSLFGVTAMAEETVPQVPEGFEELGEYLPEESIGALPEGFFSADPKELGGAVGEMMEPRALLRFVGELLHGELRGALRLLATLCGLLIFAALFETVRASCGSDALGGAVRFCAAAAIFSAILATQYGHLLRVEEYFERLSSLMGGMIPVAASVWAMGGNVTTAAAGSSTLYLFLTVCEVLCKGTVVPVCVFCMAVALCQGLGGGVGLRGVADTVKKIYTFCLGLVMTLLLSALGAQTTLTAAADSMTARTAKLLSSTVIPVVGGSVGETLRTVASGVGYLKTVVGLGGVALLLLLVLPILLELILTRLAFLLGRGVADLLGCESEGKLLGELGALYGCMIAAVAMSGVMFLLGMVLFVKSVVAMG